MKRGDLVKRVSVNGSVSRGTITHMSERGWVVVMDESIDFDGFDNRLSYSAGDSGTPADDGWELDKESK